MNVKTLLLSLALYTLSSVAMSGQHISAIKEINQKELFDSVIVSLPNDSLLRLRGSLPVIIDFNATWCGPCRKLAPILEELSVSYKGKVRFYSIDIDKNKDLARNWGIRSIPSLLLFPLEGMPRFIVGLYPKDELTKAIDYLFFNQSK